MLKMICTAPCNPTFAHRRHFTRRYTKLYRKAPTRRRTDHFAAGVTYLQFLVHVCFSSTSTN